MFNVHSLYPFPEYNLRKGRDLGMFCIWHKQTFNKYLLSEE